MDTILGIILGENYSGIRALVDLFVCVKYANKLSDAVAGEIVAELTTAYLNLLSFIFFLSFFSFLSSIPLLSTYTLHL